MKHEGAVNSAQFSPDRQRVVTASEDGTARLWDVAAGKAIGEPMKHEGAVRSAQFSADGQRVVTASKDKTARVWDAATAKAIGEPMKHEVAVNSAQFSPDRQRVVTASGYTARLWDAAAGRAIGEPMKHEGEVRTAQFSPDGQRVVTASEDKTARLWDATTCKTLGEPMKHQEPVVWAQFSPDGQRIVTASYDGTARLWDAATGKPLGKPMRHGVVVDRAQFSPDSQRVATAGDNSARLWDVPTMNKQDIPEDIILLADLAEAAAGLAIQSSETDEILNVMTSEQVRAVREKIGVKFARPFSQRTPLQRFLKWSVSDSRAGTISPFSEITIAEWIENRIKEGTVDGLRAAILVDPANARVSAHFGIALVALYLNRRLWPFTALNSWTEGLSIGLNSWKHCT